MCARPYMCPRYPKIARNQGGGPGRNAYYPARAHTHARNSDWLRSSQSS